MNSEDVHPLPPITSCPICGGSERPYGSKRLMEKYDVQYLLCGTCQFFHTEEPYWLAESYSEAIVSTDTGIVQRNIVASAAASVLFRWMFRGEGRYIDVAGGYGLFTRLMRDYGLDCYWSDPYAPNLFARGFEGHVPADQAYRAATAFEVLEHVPKPLAFVEDIFRGASCEALLFSTELYPGSEPPPTWWYYGLNTGQHISFYNRRTLHALADRLNLELNSNGQFHMLSRRRLSRFLFATLTSRAACKIVPLVSSRIFRSRLQSDHLKLIDQLKGDS